MKYTLIKDFGIDVMMSTSPPDIPQPSFTITAVRSPEDLADCIRLFYEYAKSLGLDLSFQSFDDEMAQMPGKYAPPRGDLFLARSVQGQATGCAGLRSLDQEGVCEMKRLYVAPSGRGTGVGKALTLKVVNTAENLGYREMRLDTLPSMTAAIALYQRLGFVVIEAYYRTPIEGTRFLSLALPRKIIEENR